MRILTRLVRSQHQVFEPALTCLDLLVVKIPGSLLHRVVLLVEVGESFGDRGVRAYLSPLPGVWSAVFLSVSLFSTSHLADVYNVHIATPLSHYVMRVRQCLAKQKLLLWYV